MMRYVSAADANRHFSKLLRAVAGGERVVITSRGKPVAELAPPGPDQSEAELQERIRGRRAFIEELQQRPVLNLPRMSRDEFYD